MFEDDEEELLRGLIDAIKALPRGEAWISTRQPRIDHQHQIDAVVRAEIAGVPFELLVEARREAFPRDVREAIWRLRSYLPQHPSGSNQVIPFFVARAISPGGRELLRQENIGFYDLGGTLYLPGNQAFVYVDRPAPRKSSKVFDSIFQGQKARVMLVVFEHRHDWLSVKHVAKEAQVSPATASATLSEMERREWLDVKGSGPAKLRRLRAPGPLLYAWTQYISNRKPPKLERLYVPSADANDLMHKLQWACHEADADYAVTGEAAAQAYAPFLSSVSQVRCRIIPGVRRKEALDRLQAMPVTEGWNLGLVETNARGDVSVGERIDDIALAPPLQVYLDLLHGSGRSKEMASHLRARMLSS